MIEKDNENARLEYMLNKMFVTFGLEDECDHDYQIKSYSVSSCTDCPECYIPDPTMGPHPDKCTIGGTWPTGACDYLYSATGTSYEGSSTGITTTTDGE